MSSIEIAVDGCILNHKSGSLISGGVFTITSIPSIEVKCEGKGIYETPLQFTFSGGNASGFVSGTVATIAPQSITATAIKVKGESKLVMRLGDFVLMNAQGTLTGPPPVPATPIVGLVEISSAGQTKVLAS